MKSEHDMPIKVYQTVTDFTQLIFIRILNVFPRVRLGLKDNEHLCSIFEHELFEIEEARWCLFISKSIRLIIMNRHSWQKS